VYSLYLFGSQNSHNPLLQELAAKKVQAIHVTQSLSEMYKVLADINFVNKVLRRLRSEATVGCLSHVSKGLEF